MNSQARCILLLLTSALFLVTRQGETHGVRGIGQTFEASCITASYDDGEPLSYGTVEISAPDSVLPFQSGRTDRNGLFCFKPDTSGYWRITISDEMGHQVKMKNQVAQDMVLPSTKAEQNIITKALKVTCGLSLIIGFAGSIAWWQSRKRSLKSS